MESKNPETRRAQREASALLAEHGEPKSYEGLVTLIALAYSKGTLDGLTWTQNAIRGHADEQHPHTTRDTRTS